VAGAVHVELAVAAGFEHAVEAALEQAEVEKPWASTRVAASWGSFQPARGGLAMAAAWAASTSS
jgi:hypothetical protein